MKQAPAACSGGSSKSCHFLLSQRREDPGRRGLTVIPTVLCSSALLRALRVSAVNNPGSSKNLAPCAALDDNLLVAGVIFSMERDGFVPCWFRLFLRSWPRHAPEESGTAGGRGSVDFGAVDADAVAGGRCVGQTPWHQQPHAAANEPAWPLGGSGRTAPPTV